MDEQLRKSSVKDQKSSFFSRGSLQSKILVSYVLLAVALLVSTFGFSADNRVDVTVELNGDIQTVSTSAQTVDELLEQLEVTYTANDELSHPPQTELAADMHIVWQEAVQVTIELYGEQQALWTTADTIAQLFREQGIELQDGDVVTPGLQFGIESRLMIEVAHFETSFTQEEYVVEFETERRDDDSIYVGEEQVVSSGQEGEGIYTYKVTYRNGEEIERQFVDHERLQERQNRVIAVGTKERPAPPSQTVAAATVPESSASSGSGSGGEAFTVSSTAYTANCRGCTGVTYTGLDLRNNPNQKVIAVDPNVIPLGSIVEVEGYGRAVAADIGTAIQGNKIDVFFPTRAEALRWGRRTVTVRIIE